MAQNNMAEAQATLVSDDLWRRAESALEADRVLSDSDESSEYDVVSRSDL